MAEQILGSFWWAADLPVCPQLASYLCLGYISSMVIRRRLDLTGPSMVFVTTSARDRLPIFSHKSNAIAVIDQLRETSTKFNVSLVGYVIMPTHVHLLLGFPDISILSRFVQAFKSLSARKVRDLNFRISGNSLFNGKEAHLWWERFDDVVIFSERQFQTKLDYIHNNPVRAGLVKNPVDWEFSSAGDWLSDRPGPIKIDKHFSWTDK